MDERSSHREFDALGLFGPRHAAFIDSIADLRPRMHRYCARMTGSILDGEDVMQEAIFEAYRKLGTFDDRRPIGPWLFRIAHNRCIDFLRHRQSQLKAEAGAAPPASVLPREPVGRALDRAIERLVCPSAEGASLRPAQGCFRLFERRDRRPRRLDGRRCEGGAESRPGKARDRRRRAACAAKGG